MLSAVRQPGTQITAQDLRVAGVLVAAGLVLTFGGFTEPVRADVLGALVLLPLVAPMLWRRTAPVAATGALLAIVVVLDVVLGSDVPRCLLVPPMAFALVFSSAARLDQRDALLGLGLGVGLIVAEGVSTYGGFAVVLVPVALAIWVVGRVARSHRRMADTLERRTAELRTLRDERARMEIAAERARLSGALDVALQRRLADLGDLAAAGGRANDAAAATATFVELETGSRRTLEEMRAIVGVLRDEDELPPQQRPLAHLEALLLRAKGEGARLTVEGDPHVLPPGVELSTYRIVEHLLSALDDAPGVHVGVRFGSGALELAVSGPARRDAGERIERARERVAQHRGTLDATTRGSYAEAAVSLPLLAGA